MAVSIGVIMVGLDGSIVMIANPAIAADTHASLMDLQWMTDAYLLAVASLLLFGGKLCDRLGRRLMFFLGVAGFAATSVGIGLIGTVDATITLRALQGVFGALLLPSTLAILRSTFPADRLNSALGVWGAASGLATAIGPIVGALIVEHLSWPWIFYINAPLAVLALLIAALATAESRSQRIERLDKPGTIVLCAGLFLTVFGLIKAQNWGWLTAKTLSFTVAGAFLIAVFVLIELRTSEPLLPLRLFTNRTLSIGTAVALINVFALIGAAFYVTLFFINVQDLTPIEAGVRVLPISAAIMVAAPLSGLVTNKFGPRPGMVVGLAAVAAALYLLSFLRPESSYLMEWPAFLLLGAGVGFATTASSDAIVGNAGVDDAGIVSGLQAAARQIGAVFAVSVLGSVLSSRVSSELVGDLVAAGTTQTFAARLAKAKDLVAEGVSLIPTDAPTELAQEVIHGSHSAFISGLQAAMILSAIVAVVGAGLALLAKRAEDSGSTEQDSAKHELRPDDQSIAAAGER
ncbi:MFS transporter [Mycobacterium simiae]|uniref:MFS transporter n=1 Tax=Mycobacterium simiae TaxID=1784 RepID=A0A5B1BRT0_MYCSI|nr:MFS transporter [Mycobacterium simiae]KAA1249944.1 MFS transporter [Mycobacterium simiae]